MLRPYKKDIDKYWRKFTRSSLGKPSKFDLLIIIGALIIAVLIILYFKFFSY